MTVLSAERCALVSELEQLISEERNLAPRRSWCSTCSTASMIRSGKCYQNLMVYLKPTNMMPPGRRLS